MGILVVALLLTIDSALGRNSTYEEIEYNASDAPLMSLTLRNIMEGGKPYFVELLSGKTGGNAQNDTLGNSEDNAQNSDATDEAARKSVDENASGDSESNEVSAGDANQEVSSGDGFGVSQGDAGDGLGVSDGNAVFGSEVSQGNAGDGGSADAEVSEGNATEPETNNYVMAAVPDTYFDDALFIGDSRTVGLFEYCENLNQHATFYSKVSMTIYGFNKKEFVSVPIIPAEGTDIPVEQLPTEKVTIEEALTRKQFGKIYIMLGLNELGSGTAESFTRSYGEVVNRIRELQPDAIIIIQGIMHVTHSKSSKDRVFKNSTINERNAMLSTLADGEHVFYIDMNEATDDENGALGHDLSFDNVHLKAKSYTLWYDYLKNHAFVKEKDLEENNLLLQQETEQRAAENAAAAENAQ